MQKFKNFHLQGVLLGRPTQERQNEEMLNKFEQKNLKHLKFIEIKFVLATPTYEKWTF